MTKEGAQSGGPFSRREILAGIGASATALISRDAFASGTPERITAWDDIPVLNPEQQKIYDEGILRLLGYAQNEKAEHKLIFIKHPDGSAEWKSVPMKQDPKEGKDLHIAGGEVDTEQWMAILSEAKNGALVEDFHTHPIHMFDYLPNPVTTYRDIDRLPPSPPDILGSLGRLKEGGFDENASSLLRSKVVTSAGIWESRPRSYAVLRKFQDALDAPAKVAHELLDGHPEYSSSLVRYIRSKVTSLEWLAVSLEREGGIPRICDETPQIMLPLSEILEQLLSQSDILPEAGICIKVMQQAGAAFLSALREIDPNTDGRVDQMPNLDDSFESFIKRWESLKIDLRFTPFAKKAF